MREGMDRPREGRAPRHPGAGSWRRLAPSAAPFAMVIGLLFGAGFWAGLRLPSPATLLHPPPLPRETFGIAWRADAVWPALAQSAAAERAAQLLLGLTAAAALIALLNASILLAEGVSARRRELALRSALGRTPGALALGLLWELRPLALRVLPGGLALGALFGLALRATWPGPADPVPWPGQIAAWFGLLAALAVVVAWIQGSPGWRTGRAGRLARDLRAGGFVTGDPREIFARRALPAAQIALGGALALVALALGATETRGPDAEPGGEDVYVVSGLAHDLDAWGRLSVRLDGVPGLEAESLSTPGALVGLGVRDVTIAQCGYCVRGLILMPIVPARADHHAVAPGYFAVAGLPLVQGRDFRPEDDAGSDPVAVVNRTFANSSFERGQPIGHKIRVGGSHDEWFTVVGVVEDRDWPVLGSEDRPREAVYLNARQRPPERADVLLRGTPDAVDDALAAMDAEGLSPGPVRPLRALRDDAAAPLGWVRAVALALGLLAILLAAQGVYATALQVSRRRRHELAVRRALGATGRRVAIHVLGERLRVAGWGAAGMVFLGSLAVGVLRKAAGGVPAPGPGAYLAVVLGSLLVALLAGRRAAAEARRVPPAASMR